MPHHEPHQPLLPQGMAVPAQTLDENRLCSFHEWASVPATGLQFRENVELVHNPRPDIARYKLIAQSNRAIAKNLFALMCRSTTLFKIPKTVECCRTYARDAEEAYYVDAMDEYLNAPPGEGPAELDVRDIPLLKGSLRNRMFCAFNRKPGYRSELFERRRLKRWLPSDAPENRHFDDAALADSYPDTEPWLDEIYQPPALAVPLQLSVYYYHKELRNAQICPLLGETERIRRLRFCKRKEHYVLIMAIWWNDVYYAGRMYILEQSRINILESECGTVQDIAGMPAQAIIAHMRMVAGFPPTHHNWMSYTDECMESSTFVWGIKHSGGLDTGRPSGVRLFCSKAERKISTSKYGSAMLRRSSVMDERLSIPDLDRIKGLLGLVRDREWQAHGSLRVVDLLYHLFGLHRQNHSLISDIRRELGRTREELDYRTRASEDARSELHEFQDKLEHAHDRIKSRDERLDYLESALRKKDMYAANLQDYIDSQARELKYRHSKDALRSAPQQYNPEPRSPYGFTNPLPMTSAPATRSRSQIINSAPATPSRSQVANQYSSVGNRSNVRDNASSGGPPTPAQAPSMPVQAPSTPAQVATPYRPKRGYPFHEPPLSFRKKVNRDTAANAGHQKALRSNDEEGTNHQQS